MFRAFRLGPRTPRVTFAPARKPFCSWQSKSRAKMQCADARSGTGDDRRHQGGRTCPAHAQSSGSETLSRISWRTPSSIRSNLVFRSDRDINQRMPSALVVEAARSVFGQSKFRRQTRNQRRIWMPFGIGYVPGVTGTNWVVNNVLSSGISFSSPISMNDCLSTVTAFGSNVPSALKMPICSS